MVQSSSFKEFLLCRPIILKTTVGSVTIKQTKITPNSHQLTAWRILEWDAELARIFESRVATRMSAISCLERAIGRCSEVSNTRSGRIHCYHWEGTLAANLEICLTLPSQVSSHEDKDMDGVDSASSSADLLLYSNRCLGQESGVYRQSHDVVIWTLQDQSLPSDLRIEARNSPRLRFVCGPN